MDKVIGVGIIVILLYVFALGYKAISDLNDGRVHNMVNGMVKQTR